MKCQTCNTVIPPEWKSAISSNLCPACGDKIYNTDIAELISGLADALSKMPNDAIAVAGWIVSNYEIRKIGEAKPVEKFFGTKENKPTNEKSIKIAENKFIKNTDAYKAIKATNEKMQALANAITEANPDSEMYGDGSSEISVEEEYNEEDDEMPPPPVKRMSQVLKTDQALIDPNAEIDESELIEAIQSVATSGPKLVTSDQLKRLQSQENFNESRGIFKRA